MVLLQECLLTLFGEFQTQLKSVSPDSAGPKALEQQPSPEEEPSKAAPVKLLRRFEGGSNWQRILDHSGSFHVHVGSYRDSVRAARSVALEGFSGYPACLQPVQVLRTRFPIAGLEG